MNTNPGNYYNLVILLGFLGAFLALFSLADFYMWVVMKYQARKRLKQRYYLGQF